MLKTEQCQQCKKSVYPPKRICPNCYGSNFISVPDQIGHLVAQVKNAHQDHYISLVKTKNHVLVFAIAVQALPVGQAVRIYEDNKKLISIPIEETTDEKNR